MVSNAIYLSVLLVQRGVAVVRKELNNFNIAINFQNPYEQAV